MTKSQDTPNPTEAFGDTVDPTKPICLHLTMQPKGTTDGGLYISKCSECSLEMTSHVAPKEK